MTYANVFSTMGMGTVCRKWEDCCCIGKFQKLANTHTFKAVANLSTAVISECMSIFYEGYIVSDIFHASDYITLRNLILASIITSSNFPLEVYL